MHLLDKAIASLPEGGETLVGIFDLRGFGNRNADLGFVRFLVRHHPKCCSAILEISLCMGTCTCASGTSQGLREPFKGLTLCCVMISFYVRFVVLQVDIFFTYYPKRLGQVVMVDAPFIFKPGCDVLHSSWHRMPCMCANGAAVSVLSPMAALCEWCAVALQMGYCEAVAAEVCGSGVLRGSEAARPRFLHTRYSAARLPALMRGGMQLASILLHATGSSATAWNDCACSEHY